MSFLKNREQEENWYLGVDTSGRGKDVRKGCKKVNIVEI
jgi:hypothetical protein